MFGSHLSIAGGMVNALREAESLKLDTVQVFTKNQRQWSIKPLEEAGVREWLDGLGRLGWLDRTVAHDSYLINLASPDPELWEKSVRTMREEIERCEQLSIPYLVSHPGAHMGAGVDAGIARIAKAYKRLYHETCGYRTIVCLENTAGGGSTLGRTIEELAQLRQLILEEAGADAAGPKGSMSAGSGGRVAFCLDTCHALAAGYDIASHANGDGTGKKRTVADGERLGQEMLERFDSICGLEHLRVVHLNDSVGARASRRDFHAHIGGGNVAIGAFAAVLNRQEIRDVPMILETPKGHDEKGTPFDTINLRKLRRLIASEESAGG